ncbi:flagellar motor protein MotB [Fulvivirgaceae bacterium PWU4]|uniref:Flagellar motor protein MotB n=1 Tax=Chryseosolibacter histidini TaxID=2782349 RepID=A0AAP2DR84_9BACT|nr:flagellar motor protein MotB [Chryseosolibacter histidini]MBT1699537.1 flagellar motor protein MotB [Chryseosolibacter histidini]
MAKIKRRLQQGLIVLFCNLLMACASGKLKEEINTLNGRNALLEKNSATLRSELRDLSTHCDSLHREYNNYRSACEFDRKALSDMRQILAGEQEILERVHDKLTTALIDFSNRGVAVFYRQGLLHVSLADDLLYATGSSKLGENGKKALEKLAQVLNDYPRLKVIVLGNTDDVKYRKGGDNWSLSTERANGVVKLLCEAYHVEPARLTAAGKGKYNPVADNLTPEGRAKNRRTDIILNPDIDRIWNSVVDDY